MKIAPKFNEEIGKQKSLLEERHLSGAGGFEICRQWSNFTDGLISELLNKTIGKSDKSGFTIAALGGYGRGELNPHSDIDLLFLFEKEVSVKSNTAPTRIIPSLWDLGFKVGHSARTVTDCIRIAREDAISRTSMIEARFLMGNRELFDYLERMLKKKVIMKKLSHFLRSKRLEMELRHEKYNKTLFLTEPNVKESPGGLRDYQTAIWVAIGRYGVRNIEGLEKRGLLSLNEKEEVFSAVDFLLKIRNDLHFLESAPNDVLAYGLQPRIAKRLGYRGDDEETVPALMNDYFRAADTVFHFAMSIVDQAIRHRSRARMLLLRLRHRQIAPNIFAGHEEIYIKDISPEDIASSPEKVFQILEVAAEYELKISPVLRKTLGAVGKIWKKQKPDSKRLADGFRSLLQRDDSSEQLRIMRDVKILTSIIPEFHAIRYHTPFDLYHRYTVDDHTFIAMSEFDNLKRNDRTECDVLRSLYESEKRKDLIRLAILLHDVGKGNRIQRHESDFDTGIVKRLGYSDEEAQTVGKLVKLHLLMNLVAQRRDMYDHKAITQFCKKVGDAETLKKLYMLTFADTSAVAPGVWNSWKGTLLKELFAMTMDIFHETPPAPPPLEILSPKARELVRNMPSYYLSIRKPELIERDTELFSKFIEEKKTVVTAHRIISENEPGEFTLIARDKLGLLSRLVGALLSKNVNIHHAQVLTRNDGIVVDFFRVTGHNDRPILDEEFWARIEVVVEKVLKGEENVEEMLLNRQKMMFAAENLPKIEPRVKVLNEESFDHSVIEISARDRLGLLYDITRTFNSMKIDIVSARITTEGHRAVDSFYVCESNGGKIKGSERIQELKKELLSKLG